MVIYDLGWRDINPPLLHIHMLFPTVSRRLYGDADFSPRKNGLPLASRQKGGH